MSLRVFILCVLSLASGLIQAMAQQKYDSLPDGFKYKIYKSVAKEKAKLGDAITFDFVLHNSEDSLLTSSYKMGRPYTNTLIYKNFSSMTEGFLMLGKGDSAAFFISADSVTKGRPDKAMRPGTLVKYTIKIINVQSAADYNKELFAQKAKEDSEAEVNKAKEGVLLEAYLKTKAPNAIKTKSGLCYVIEKEGSGPLPENGDTIIVHYRGSLIDGTEFDNDHGDVFRFKLGLEAGDEGSVIEGWNDAFRLLKKGSKARLIIPSSLAYGDRDIPGRIPSYSTLIFEVELVDIVK